MKKTFFLLSILAATVFISILCSPEKLALNTEEEKKRWFIIEPNVLVPFATWRAEAIHWKNLRKETNKSIRLDRFLREYELIIRQAIANSTNKLLVSHLKLCEEIQKFDIEAKALRTKNFILKDKFFRVKSDLAYLEKVYAEGKVKAERCTQLGLEIAELRKKLQ